MAVSAALDGVVFVVEAERTTIQQAQAALGQLQTTETKVLGTVLNKQRPPLPRWLDRRLRRK